MTEPEDSTLASQLKESPYAAPPMVGESPLGLPHVAVPAMPVGLILIYAGIATALTMLGIVAINELMLGELGILVIASPMLVIALFVVLYLRTAAMQGPAAAISTTWKTTVLILVPPASMICFVPTCVGSTIFLMPLIENSLRNLGISIPIFIAYATTCFMVAFRLRSRIMQRAQTSSPADSDLLASTSADSPFSVPEARKPQ